MIIKKSRDKAALTATAEDADDLLALRRVIKRGDIVTGSTTRVIKRDRDYSRPDRGERVRIVASVVVERISLDGTLERLKIGGTVSESNNDDAVPHGAHHSLAVTAGSTITIAKRSAKSGRSRWSGTDHRILQRRGGATSGKKESFLLVAVDTNDCGVASLRGTHLEVTPNIYSGIGGKRYKTSRGMDDFFDKAAAAIDALLDDGVQKIVMFGPGNTKRRLANYMYSGSTGQSRGRSARGVRGCDITVVEGIDSGGEDGIYTFTKSEAMREVMSESKLARVSGLLDRIIEYAHRKIPRYALGYEETLAAARQGAIDSLIFADGALRQYGDEQKVVDLLNMVEAAGADVYGVDSSTDIGLRASGLGGIVALLRYATAELG